MGKDLEQIVACKLRMRLETASENLRQEEREQKKFTLTQNKLGLWEQHTKQQH